MNNIREIRLRKRLTQKAVACIAGISQSYLNELERGRKSNPSILTLEKIASGLAVDVAELIGSASSDAGFARTENTMLVVDK